MMLRHERRHLAPAMPPRAASLGAAAAMAAVGAAAIVQYRTRAAEQEFPPRGSFATVDGVKLHYLAQGAGPAVLFLHGNGVMAEDFVTSGLLDLAARSSYAVAIDRPGFGYSERPWTRSWTAAAQARLMLEAISALGLARPVIVAHSWATMIALEMALLEPQSIGGLVLVSGYYYPSVRADVALFSPPALPFAGDLLRYTFGPLVGEALKPRLVRKMFAPMLVPHAFRHRFPQALMTRPGQIRANAEDAAHMIGAAHALTSRYAELKLPVTILAGSDDGIVDASQPERLNLALRQSSFDRITGAGHMLHYSHPERVMEAVRDMQREL